MTRPWSYRCAFLLCFAALGCGGEEHDAADTDAGGASDAAHVHEEEEDDAPCPTTIPTFEAGLTVAGRGGLISARVVSARPSSPQVFENDWVLEFIDASGTPIDDIKLTRVEPYMTVHGHGAGYDPTLTPLAEPGRVSLERINLKMPGPWEVRLSAESKRVGVDFIVMNVCVPKK